MHACMQTDEARVSVWRLAFRVASAVSVRTSVATSVCTEAVMCPLCVRVQRGIPLRPCGSERGGHTQPALLPIWGHGQYRFAHGE